MVRRAVTAVARVLVLVLAVSGLVACGSVSDRGGVGYLGAVSADSPLENGVARATLPPTFQGANLLVAIAMGDGPDSPATQHSLLGDTGRHQWTRHDHHIVFGSIIDVYTAPANGSEAGAVLSSEMTVKRGDEGHTLTVLAYRHGHFEGTTERNGHFGIPQLRQSVPAGEDVLTAFGDGRQNTPITPVPGFRPLHALPIADGDRDLYQVSRLEPPGSWSGGEMLTGNLAPPASAYWGLVNVNIAPA